MSSEEIIKVQELGKCYPIFETPLDRLKQMVLPRVQRAVGVAPRRYYREYWALRNVTFEVRRGETVGIVGRNGSGKSTLLQLVCGTLTPTVGQVSTRGRLAGLLELGAGFNPEFTGRENVFLNAQILGLSRSEIEARLDDILAFAGIGDFVDHPVKIYSSGMFVRLAFAVAIHTDPDILVIDEALAVGDVAFQTKCLGRIRQMQREGVAILLVSHAPNTIVEFCERAIYLHRGELVSTGKSREIVEVYANDIVAEEGGIGTSRSQHSEGTFNSKSVHVETGHNDGKMLAATPRSEILSVHIKDTFDRECGVFSFGEELVLKIKVRFNEANVNPCFGVQISSVDGINLWSVTTARMDIRVPPQSAAVEREFSWRLKLYVGGSRFVVALGIGGINSGEYLRHHRLEYAGFFDVLPLAKAGSGWLGIKPLFEGDAASSIKFRCA